MVLAELSDKPSGHVILVKISILISVREIWTNGRGGAKNSKVQMKFVYLFHNLGCVWSWADLSTCNAESGCPKFYGAKRENYVWNNRTL